MPIVKLTKEYEYVEGYYKYVVKEGYNKDGKQVMVTNKFMKKRVYDRRQWKKFGLASVSNDGVTYKDTPIIFKLQPLEKKVVEEKKIEDSKPITISNAIKCRFCGKDDHLSFRCPTKNRKIKNIEQKNNSGIYVRPKRNEEYVVCIRNLPEDFERHNISDMIGRFLSRPYVKLLTDRNTGRSKCIAFVTFNNKEDAQQIIDNFNKKRIEHVVLSLTWTESRKK